MSTLARPAMASIAALPGVAAGRPDDGDPLAPLREDVVEQPADDLQGDVLERQRRPVEQLQQPLVGAELHEGADGRVAERLGA